MPRTLHAVVGLVIMAIGVVVAWSGISADFADLGAVARQHGDDGTIPGIVVLVSGAVLFVLGIVVIALPLQRRR